MSLAAGKLNCRVTIQCNKSSTGEFGEPVTAWADVAQVWASIAHKSGLETIKSGADISIVQASIRIRYREDVTAAMRVVYRNAIYDIRAVLRDVTRHEYCDLICEQGANDG